MHRRRRRRTSQRRAARRVASHPAPPRRRPDASPLSGEPLKDASWREIQASKEHSLQHRRGAGAADRRHRRRVTFTFSPTHRALREQFEQTRPWLETAAERLAGRRIPVVVVQRDDGAPTLRRPQPRRAAHQPGAATRRPDARDLKAEAMSSRPCRRCSTSSRRDPGRGRDLMTMNIQAMMQQARQMQERLQKQMAEMRVEATAGGGMVTVVMNGTKQLQSIRIDPEVVSKDDVEMLQDLIVAAVNDANRKVDEQLGQSMRACSWSGY